MLPTLLYVRSALYTDLKILTEKEERIVQPGELNWLVL